MCSEAVAAIRGEDSEGLDVQDQWVSGRKGAAAGDDPC